MIAHPRARKTTDVIHSNKPATAAITTTIIKSSQSQDIYSVSLGWSLGKATTTERFPCPWTCKDGRSVVVASNSIPLSGENATVTALPAPGLAVAVATNFARAA